ncbi:MAG: DUF2341 domain-containing protein, partial [Candidatus Hadarchaeota archaeon]|nr:DUF2341 domain-containing protein [Candidatus Hadarchaeota archaeon]
SDFDDLRFCDSSDNPLSYWIENYTPSVNATVWVKVLSIPTSGTTIYMHYGNPDASSASNGTNTFEFFEDFDDGDDNDWTKHNGNWYVTNYEYYQGSNDTTYMRTSNGEPSWTDYIFETRIKIASGGTTGGFAGVLFRFQDEENHYAVILDDRPDDSIWIRQWINGSWSTAPQEWTDVTIERDTWYDLRVDIFDDGPNDKIKAHFCGIVHEHSYSQYDNGKVALMMHGTQGYYDNIRVRKHADPEPSVSIGDETLA